MRSISCILFAALSLLFGGCKKNVEAEKSATLPSITSVNFEKNIFALGQVTVVSATVTHPENDNDIKLSLHLDKILLAESKEGSNEIICPINSRIGEIGEKELTLKATDSKGNSVLFTKKITVVNPDFRYAIWGDNKEIVERSEKFHTLPDSESAAGFNPQYIYSAGNTVVSGTEELKIELRLANYQLVNRQYIESIKRLTNTLRGLTPPPASRTLTKDQADNILIGNNFPLEFSNERTKATLNFGKKGEEIIATMTYTPK